jgi:hypothetical protein
MGSVYGNHSFTSIRSVHAVMILGKIPAPITCTNAIAQKPVAIVRGAVHREPSISISRSGPPKRDARYSQEYSYDEKGFKTT